MIDDLINREAAIEAAQVPDGECSNREERYGIIYARVEARKRIREIPSVPAVPLGQLCKRLCDIDEVPACLTCYNLKIDGYCNNCGSEEHWHAVITKLMENQNE